MNESVRRSWLLVPMSKVEQITEAARSGADVIVLDLAELVAEEDKPAARKKFQAAIPTALAGGAEVFAQIDPGLLYEDFHACVWPGLSGLVVSRTESYRQAAHEISCASRRLWGLTLGRADLIMDLRPEPSGEPHLMPYLMQRLIVIAGAAGVTPIGAWWRAPDRGLLATPDNTFQAARRGRAIGFMGAMCLRADQVEPLNRGFTPDSAEVEAAQRLQAAYQARVAAGAADLTQGDRLIDRGAAARARSLLALAGACAARGRV